MPNLSKNRHHPALVALGDSVRRVRLEQGISQEHLALISDVDRSYIGRVERGDNNIAMLTLLKVATALGISASELLKNAKL